MRFAIACAFACPPARPLFAILASFFYISMRVLSLLFLLSSFTIININNQTKRGEEEESNRN
jgi:hypothetical protein